MGVSPAWSRRHSAQSPRSPCAAVSGEGSVLGLAHETPFFSFPLCPQGDALHPFGPAPYPLQTAPSKLSLSHCGRQRDPILLPRAGRQGRAGGLGLSRALALTPPSLVGARETPLCLFLLHFLTCHLAGSRNTRVRSCGSPVSSRRGAGSQEPPDGPSPSHLLCKAGRVASFSGTAFPDPSNQRL